MGDVITKVDDMEIETVEDLNLAKKKYRAGDSAKLEVFRPEGTVTLDLIWDAAPRDEQVQEEQPAQQYPSNGNNSNGNGGNGGYYSPFDDLFRYFYG